MTRSGSRRFRGAYRGGESPLLFASGVHALHGPDRMRQQRELRHSDGEQQRDGQRHGDWYRRILPYFHPDNKIRSWVSLALKGRGLSRAGCVP